MFLQLCKRRNYGDNGEKLDGHISHEHYLTYKFSNEFIMKNLGDYQSLFEERCFVIT